MIFFIIMIVFSPFTAVISALYVSRLLLSKKLKVEKNYWNIGLFLLFIYAVFSAIFNKSILSLLAAIGMFLYFSIAIIFENYLITTYRINRVLKYMVYVTLLSAFVGIVEKAIFLFMAISNHRIFSTFGNPNMAGGWFASTILVIIYLQSIDEDKRNLKIYDLYLIIIVIALLLTESTGAFIALLGSLFIYYLLRQDKNLKSTVGLITTVSIVALVFFIIQHKITATTPINEIVTSFNSRYDIWVGSLQMFLKKPIVGWGLLGTLEHGVDFMYHNGNSIHSHNLCLTFLVSLGAVGFSIYIYIKANLIKDLIKIYKMRNKILPLLVSLNIMVIIQGMVDCTLYAPQLGILFIATGIITYNIANNKIVKRSKIVEVKETGENNNDIVV